MYFTDYDECNATEGIPVCGPNAMCTNVESTYNCTCLEGYISNGVTCVGRNLFLPCILHFLALDMHEKILRQLDPRHKTITHHVAIFSSEDQLAFDLYNPDYNLLQPSNT